MNILFVLYGDFSSNSTNPLALYARELHRCGHHCAVAVPSGLETVSQHENVTFRPVLYDDTVAAPLSLFPDGRPADVIHACTPREVVRRFVTSYMASHPTPLVIYLEDNERWVSMQALGFDEATLNQHTEEEIAEQLPTSLSHPFRYENFIGLADAVAVIQAKLAATVPPWVYCETVMIGVDLESFFPRPSDPSLRGKYGVLADDKVIVYHGGLNQFTRPGIETLCAAVGLLRQRGYPCSLLRTGRYPLDFLGQLPRQTASAIVDLGWVPRNELPDLLALADVFVQPGQLDAFEDLRLPGKVPEFLAMGRPVIMPDVNIAHLFRNGSDAVLLQTGSASEIATKCVELFSDPDRACKIGWAGRQVAEKYFDVRRQARCLEHVYKIASNDFNRHVVSETWRGADQNTPVSVLLARKLRLLTAACGTKADMDAGTILKEYARYIELLEQRTRGLGVTVAERDREITRLREVIEHFRHGKKWNLMASLRKMKSLLRCMD